MEDKEQVLQMIEQTCKSLPENIIPLENYLKVAEVVLSDIDWGFFILAQDGNKNPVGLMYFTNEWSDWRNGLFLWL